MAGVPAGLPAVVRVSDHISLGVIAKTSLATGCNRFWPRPARRASANAVKIGVSQARSRSGERPLRRLHEQVVQPMATRATKGARYRGWRLSSLDGSSLKWPTRPRMARASGIQVRAAVRVPFRSSALWRWWRRHANTVRRPAGRLSGWRSDAGPRRGAGAPAGHAVLGRPTLFRARALASRNRHRRRPAVAGEGQPAAAAPNGAGRRVVSFGGSCKRQGPAARGRWHPGAHDGIPAARRGGRRAAVLAGDQDPGPA